MEEIIISQNKCKAKCFFEGAKKAMNTKIVDQFSSYLTNMNSITEKQNSINSLNVHLNNLRQNEIDIENSIDKNCYDIVFNKELNKDEDKSFFIKLLENSESIKNSLICIGKLTNFGDSFNKYIKQLNYIRLNLRSVLDFIKKIGSKSILSWFSSGYEAKKFLDLYNETKKKCFSIMIEDCSRMEGKVIGAFLKLVSSL